MEYFEVEGGHKLSGEIQPQGAKNEALQVLSAVLLTEEPVIIENVPEILDVLRLIEILKKLGVEIQKIQEGKYSFQASHINEKYLNSEEYLKDATALRGSIMLVGALLSRLGYAIMPKPGGDKIGRRRLDTHFLGLQKLSASFVYDSANQIYKVFVDGNLKGSYILLDEASVTGTANVILASVFAKGITTIFNAACEPYVQQLCRMLVAMGAKIEGIGSNLLHITGVSRLNGTYHKIQSDMIEIGSFIAMAAMTQSHLTILNAYPDELGIIPLTFQRLGLNLQLEKDKIIVPEQDIYEIETFIDGSILTISDHTWPGFTPDLISVALVVATQAKGNVLIHQKMFESRLFFVDKLIEMGAQIILCDPHRATVIGLGRTHPLRGISMTSPDIRAGVAMLIAAMSAQGISKIFNIEQIDRGYMKIDERLNALGAKIHRVKNVHK
jgi:UDP-N-acetylglucosamine 1-carboxyvinyltransferase